MEALFVCLMALVVLAVGVLALLGLRSLLAPER
jgi:hypothetical protein